MFTQKQTSNTQSPLVKIIPDQVRAFSILAIPKMYYAQNSRSTQEETGKASY